MDDRIRAAARAVQDEVDSVLDTDADLAATLDRASSEWEPQRSTDRPRRRAMASIAAAAVVILAGTAALLLLRLGADDDAFRTVAPSNTGADTEASSPTTIAGTTAASTTTDPVPGGGKQWVPQPIVLPPVLALDDVPKLVLRDEALPAPTRVIIDAPAAGDDYLQVFTSADGAAWLHIETTTGSQPDLSDAYVRGEPIGPWSTAASTYGESIRLTSRDITVWLTSNVATGDELRAVAASLSQGESPSDGWAVSDLLHGLEPVAEGRWSMDPSLILGYFDDTGYIAALEVLIDAPSLLSTESGQFPDPDHQVVEVDGKRALYIRDQVSSTLVLQYLPRIVVRVGLTGDPGLPALLKVASSLTEIPQPEWDQLDSITHDDGCPSLWC